MFLICQLTKRKNCIRSTIAKPLLQSTLLVQFSKYLYIHYFLIPVYLNRTIKRNVGQFSGRKRRTRGPRGPAWRARKRAPQVLRATARTIQEAPETAPVLLQPLNRAATRSASCSSAAVYGCESGPRSRAGRRSSRCISDTSPSTQVQPIYTTPFCAFFLTLY